MIDPGLHIPTSQEVQHEHMPQLLTEVNRTTFEKLSRVLGVTLAFDLWMSRKTEDVLSVEAHFITRRFEWQTVHLGLLCCDKGTAGKEVGSRN